MRIVVATGLFPPDIGGPATHAADLSAELARRGHAVTVLTLGDGPRSTTDGTVRRYPRKQWWPRRTIAGIAWLVRHRRDYDLVYATGLPLVAVPGARLARRPVVLKVVGDQAWERGRQRGLTGLGFDEFQRERRVPIRLRALRASRDWTIRHATRVVAPGRALAGWIEAWVPGTHVAVVPNGVRMPETGTVSPEGSGLPVDGSSAPRPLRLVSAGRLVVHKRVDVLLDALAATDGITLDVVGDGPERSRLEAQAEALGLGTRACFHGALGRDETVAVLAANDALVAVSAYEGLPHVVLEALAQGTPVVCAAAQGLLEVVADGENGLVVDPLDAATLAATLTRLQGDAPLRRRLSAGATETGGAWPFDRCADALVAMFETAARGRPRAVFVGKTRIPEAPTAQVLSKFALHATYLDQVSIGTGRVGYGRIAGVRVLKAPALRPAALGGLVFYSLAPVAALAAAVRRKPSAIVCQSPYEAVGVIAVRRALPARLRPPVRVEVHGDWRTASRLYGSRARRVVSPVSDRLCRWALLQATQVRAIGDFTEGLARSAGYLGPIDRYPTYSRYDEFLVPAVKPLPGTPQALFVGVLERYKAVDLLLDAWPLVHARVPGGRLVIVGTGTMADEVARRIASGGIDGTVELRAQVGQPELVDLLDASTCLVLPSRSEGLGRVVLEAMARGRAVVATDAGGPTELIDDGVNGRLVPPEDTLALADAIGALLVAPADAARMGSESRCRMQARQPAAEYEAGIQRLATWIASGAPADPPPLGP